MIVLDGHKDDNDVWIALKNKLRLQLAAGAKCLDN